MAHIKQSRPHFGLGSEVIALKIFQPDLSSLASFVGEIDAIVSNRVLPLRSPQGINPPPHPGVA